MIHYMGHGMTACLMGGVPKDWKEGHKWSSDWTEVTCPECLAGKEEIQTFTIGDDGKSITCLRCNKTSFHPKDVEEEYCGHCKVFHDDIWPPARAAWIRHADRNVINVRCPYCQTRLNAHHNISNEGPPMSADGDVSICIKCAEISIFAMGQLRKPTEEESEMLAKDERIAEAQQKVRDIHAIKHTTMVFSGADEGYRKLADVTFPVMDTWARAHGMKFVGFLSMPAGSFLNQFWTGVAWGLELLRHGYQRIIYFDADQLITNLGHTFEEIPYTGFHVSKDWGTDATEPWHFSMCGFIAHQDCIPLFEAVLAMEPEWRDKPFQEQGPFREKVRQLFEANDAKLIHIHPRKVFNCVPDAVCPGQIPEPWAPGDFAAHLTMVSMERRLELIDQFIPATLASITACRQSVTPSTRSGVQSESRT